MKSTPLPFQSLLNQSCQYMKKKKRWTMKKKIIMVIFECRTFFLGLQPNNMRTYKETKIHCAINKKTYDEPFTIYHKIHTAVYKKHQSLIIERSITCEYRVIAVTRKVRSQLGKGICESLALMSI